MTDRLLDAANTRRPTASERLQNPDAVLTRSDLRDLGWERRAVDTIMRNCETIHLPGYSRPVIKVGAYLAYLAEHTYEAGGDRVRATGV